MLKDIEKIEQELSALKKERKMLKRMKRENIIRSNALVILLATIKKDQSC